MKQKITLRLSLIALIAVLATALCLTLVYYNLFQLRVRSDLQMSAQLLADTGVFQNAYAASEDTNRYGESSVFQTLEEDNLRITWISPDGTVLYDNDTNPADLSNHLNRPEIQSALQYGSGASVRRSDTLKLNTYYYALRLEDGTILRVSTQARSITSVFLASLPVILLLLVIVLTLCILLSYLLTAQLLRPIEQMAEHLDDDLVTPVYSELEPFSDRIRSQHDRIIAAVSSRQDFTANVSHELKTPLTAISGYAELLENEMVPPERAPHIAEEIRHNADRLLSLINDIIRLSELDHKELPRKFTSLNLFALAEDACAGLQVSAQKKRVTLKLQGGSVQLSAEPDLLKELLDNLIQNAIQYNHEGGWVHVTVSESNGHAILTVQDNGIGIPADQQDRVFERFYRVDKSRSRATGGTGLGLSIVKHIAEIHNARITLESEPGRGTAITVHF